MCRAAYPQRKQIGRVFRHNGQIEKAIPEPLQPESMTTEVYQSCLACWRVRFAWLTAFPETQQTRANSLKLARCQGAATHNAGINFTQIPKML
jgi:hypothetical protein